MNNFSSKILTVAQKNCTEIDSNIAINRFAISLFNNCNLSDLVIYIKSKNELLNQKFAYGVKGGKNAFLIKNPLTLEVGKGIVGMAAESQDTKCVYDIHTSSDYIEDITVCGSELAVPLIYKGKLLGVLDSESAGVGFFNREHIKAFHFAAHFIAPLLFINSKKGPSTPRLRFIEFEKLIAKDEIYLRNDMSQNMMAEMMGLSSQYLASLISQFSEYSFSQIIATYRVKKAEELLLSPDYSKTSINQIFYESGFSSKSSFNRIFKLVTGFTPTEYTKTGS